VRIIFRNGAFDGVFRPNRVRRSVAFIRGATGEIAGPAA
jgi:hypothetical protein